MSTISETSAAPKPRHWTVEQYHQLGELGAFKNEPVEFAQGRVYVKHDGLPKRWTHEEYHASGDAGLFDGERVELIDGEIYVMSPMSIPHAAGIQRVQHALQRVCPEELLLRVQLPVLTDRSEPEPNVALVRGSLEDFDEALPTCPMLAVEVSISSLQFDRTKKLTTYARQKIQDYWILNLVDDCLEVYREPSDDSYQQRTVLQSGESVSPLAIPQATIDVAKLLPRRSD